MIGSQSLLCRDIYNAVHHEAHKRKNEIIEKRNLVNGTENSGNNMGESSYIGSASALHIMSSKLNSVALSDLLGHLSVIAVSWRSAAYCQVSKKRTE